MLRYIFPPKCPLDPKTEAWVNECLEWLLEVFGLAVLDAPPVLPVPGTFPEAFDGSEDNLRLVLDRILDHVGVARDKVSLEIYEEEDVQRKIIEAGRLEGGWSSGGSAGHYIQEGGSEPGVHVVGIERKTALSAVGTVATFAHEAMHALLLGNGHLHHDDPGHEPMTDLATVYFGYGVFTANALIRETGWQDAQGSGWSVGRSGYLSFPILGYALAQYARMRGERKPTWVRRMRPDARVAFKRAQRYLHHFGSSEVASTWPIGG